MTSVPSASARAAVSRCPRRVLQDKGRGGPEKRPAQYELGAFPGPPRWTVGEERGARLREAGRLGLGLPGPWDIAPLTRGPRPGPSRGACHCPEARWEVHGVLPLGCTCLLFHWSTERRGGPPPVACHGLPTRPLKGGHGNPRLRVTLGTGDPNLWKWHLVWKEARPTALTGFQSMASVRKQATEELVANSTGDRIPSEEAYLVYEGLLLGLERTNLGGQANILLSDALLAVQEGTYVEALETTQPMVHLIKEARTMGSGTTCLDDLENTQLMATVLKEALKMGPRSSCLETLEIAQLAAIVLKEARMTWSGPACPDALEITWLVAILLKKDLLTRQKAICQESPEATIFKEGQLTGQYDIVSKALVASLQADGIEIQRLRQLQQQRLRQQRWER